MRNLFIKLVLLVASAAFISVVNFENKKQLSNLTLNNIEALAAGEDDPSIYCIGEGSIDCNGRKVRATYKPYSFEYLK